MYIPPAPLHRISRPLAAFLMLVLQAAPQARADIYRFVTVDGVETFTDAPMDKQARLVIREQPSGRSKKSTGKKAEKTISLNEVAARTVAASLSPGELSPAVMPILPLGGGTITSGVGMRIDPIDGKLRHHNGIDIAVPEGTPIPPAAPGMVVYSGRRSGYGNTVLVEHSNGMITLYAHNSRLLVSPGQMVDTNTAIALSGNTGRSTGPHLHFEAWLKGANVTPEFMPGTNGKLPKLQLADYRPKAQFRRETLSDGSILFTNIPQSVP